MTNNKESVAIDFFAFTFLILGLGTGYRYMSEGGIQSYLGLFFWDPELIGLVATPVWVFVLILSAFALFQKKPWARHLVLSTTGLIVLYLVNRLILLGPSTEEYYYLGSLTAATTTIWFFNRGSIIARFPSGKVLKIVSRLWFVLLVLGIVSAVGLWFFMGGHKIPKLVKVPSESIVMAREPSSDLVLNSFPFKYVMMIPEGSDLGGFMGSDKLDMIVLRSPEGVGIVMSDSKRFGLFSDLWDSLEIPQGFGYANSYQFAQKQFSERYGLFYVLLWVGLSYYGPYELQETHMGGLDLFIQKGRNKHRQTVFVYLFKDQEAIGEVHINKKNEDGVLSEELINSLIASIEYQEEPSLSDREFFEEGMASLKREDYRSAKLSLASAIHLNPVDSRYRYQLARAFLKTGSPNWAKPQLQEAIKLKPDYEEAIKLLADIEVKEQAKKSEK